MKQLVIGIALLGLLLAPAAARADRYTTTEIQGWIFCESGARATGAAVSLAGTAYSATTDWSGYFIIRNVPQGTYTFKVEMYGVVQKTIENFYVARKPIDLGTLTISCIQPCTSNSTCAAINYCAKAAGDCSGQGACTQRPAVCDQVYDPVCGCNGITYGNSCEAAKVGVNVQYAGTCIVLPPPPVSCTDNTQCGASEYCGKAISDCSGLGTCLAKPSACTMLVDPVCGCDNKTYNNDCEAATAGVNVQYKGACAPPPVTCVDNTQCLATEYCQYRAGTCYGEGVCAARPTTCTTDYNPVCGCDDKTYTNSCWAAAAGTTIYGAGACDTSPPRFDY